MELGLFGGSFNPIHLGHLRVAEEVCQALGLDLMLFVPASRPPHKLEDQLAPAHVRLELVRSAISGNPRFGASDIELKRSGPSYSVDTIKELKELYKPDRLWFIMGTDQFLELGSWYRYREIVEEANLAVLMRPDYPRAVRPPKELEGEFTATETGFIHEKGGETRLVNVTQLSISSSGIRRELQNGRSVRYLVPDSILDKVKSIDFGK